MAEIPQCGVCGAPLPQDAPAGLCPACLLRTAVESGTAGPVRYFGDYELLAEIGRGGMGVVYKARQVSLDRTVAVKMMRPGLLATDDEIRRFHAEAKAAASLRHPNIVAIHEIGEQDGLFYYSMDFVEGRSLARIVREQPLPPKEAARCCMLIAEAVDFAHSRDTLHRDPKPSNVMVDEQGQPHITDFGLAGSLTPDPGHSLTGSVIGTPAYMSPEQASGRWKGLSASSDVYSLGAILYESLTGRPPFQAESAFDTIKMVIESQPVSPRVLNPKLSRDLETVVLKCLEKDPGRRYQTAGQLAADLGRFLRHEPVCARRRGVAAQGWSWCRRHPWPTAAVTATLLLTAVSVVAARQFRERLFESRLEQAKLQRLMENGAEAQTLLQEAAKMRPTNPVRQEAIEQSLRPGARLLFSVPVGEVKGFAFSEDSKRIGVRGVYFTHTGPADPAVTKVWSIEPYRLLDRATMTVADFPCYCACTRKPLFHEELQLDKAAKIIPSYGAFSADKRLYAATVVQGSSYETDIWDTTTGHRFASLPQNWDPVWSPDGRKLATMGGGAVTVGTTNLTSGDGSVPGVTMSSTHVMVWQVTAPTPVYHVPESVTSLSFSPDGKQWVANGLVLAGSGQRLGHYAMYDTSGRLIEAEIQPDGWPVEKVGIGHGVRIWEQAPEGREILLHNPGYAEMGFQPQRSIIPALGVFLKVKEIVVSPDGHRAVIRSDPWTMYPGGGGSSSGHQVLELWDLDTGNRLTVLRAANPQRTLGAVAFSPDSSQLAVLSYNGSSPYEFFLWNARTGKFVRGIQDPRLQNGLLRFSPDGNTVFYQALDLFFAFDIPSGRAVRTWKSEGETIRCIAISPDGRVLASGNSDGTIRLWRTSDGEAMGGWEAQKAAVTALAFSPSGGDLASGAEDGSVRLWNTAAMRRQLSALGMGF